MRDPPLYFRKRFAPSPGELLLQAANLQNSYVLTVQSIPKPSVPLPQDYAHRRQESPQKIGPQLTRGCHLAPSPLRPLPPSLLGKRRFLLNATRIGPYSSDNRRRARKAPRPENLSSPSARSERRASRIAALSGKSPKNRGWPPKRDRLLTIVQRHSVSAPVSRLVWQS